MFQLPFLTHEIEEVMHKIIALCDYQGRFGSKHYDKPYRSGMDKSILKRAFEQYGSNLEYLALSETGLQSITRDKWVLYTSQEDFGYEYKSYIEDIIFGIELTGAKLIPSYKFLRANNNKVFMEMLRKTYLPPAYQLKSQGFGTAEEALQAEKNFSFPIVIKASEGAGSHGVCLASDENELKRKIHKIARTRYLQSEIRDFLRSKKHADYTQESLYRKKFILQEYIPGLDNDWKVLVFGEKYYVLRRRNRSGDFRASGSGLFSFDEDVNPALLAAAEEIKNAFDVPIISLDLALSGDRVILIEFQFVYFGTSTLEKSPYYYTHVDNGWMQIFAKSILEQEFAHSIADFIKE